MGTTAWWLLLAMGFACALACDGLGFSLDVGRAAIPGAGIAVLMAAVGLGRLRSDTRLALGGTAFLQMTLFSVVGVVLSYALAARGGAPEWDAILAAADARLGFRWPLVLSAADAHPSLLLLGGVAYYSLVAQMIACIVFLSATRRSGRLHAMVTAAIASGFATILVSGATPATGNLFDPSGYAHLWPSVAWNERHLISGLRDGSIRRLDLTALTGIVTFPSYHATLPVILAWSVRGVRLLRVVAPVWAAATILATPLFGGHYAVDVLAGLVLALPAVALARALDAGRA